MLIKYTPSYNKKYLIIVLVIFLLLLSLPLIIPFNIYRNIGLFIINSTSSIHGINENSFNENKYINVTHRFYNPLIIVINYINSFTIERDKLKINLSMFDYQKLNYRINLAKKRGQINRADKNVEVNAKIFIKIKNLNQK